mmetsp:Transcript_20281/g.77877  ORF Transcript_20281/g.77877 Transcript_20281/m.77877 type:complete len:776 (+) Transcript_20281:236-2563(+)
MRELSLVAKGSFRSPGEWMPPDARTGLQVRSGAGAPVLSLLALERVGHGPGGQGGCGRGAGGARRGADLASVSAEGLEGGHDGAVGAALAAAHPLEEHGEEHGEAAHGALAEELAVAVAVVLHADQLQEGEDHKHAGANCGGRCHCVGGQRASGAVDKDGVNKAAVDALTAGVTVVATTGARGALHADALHARPGPQDGARSPVDAKLNVVVAVEGELGVALVEDAHLTAEAGAGSEPVEGLVGEECRSQAAGRDGAGAGGGVIVTRGASHRASGNGATAAAEHLRGLVAADSHPHGGLHVANVFVGVEGAGARVGPAELVLVALEVGVAGRSALEALGVGLGGAEPGRVDGHVAAGEAAGVAVGGVLGAVLRRVGAGRAGAVVVARALALGGEAAHSDGGRHNGVVPAGGGVSDAHERDVGASELGGAGPLHGEVGRRGLAVAKLAAGGVEGGHVRRDDAVGRGEGARRVGLRRARRGQEGRDTHAIRAEHNLVAAREEVVAGRHGRGGAHLVHERVGRLDHVDLVAGLDADAGVVQRDAVGGEVRELLGAVQADGDVDEGADVLHAVLGAAVEADCVVCSVGGQGDGRGASLGGAPGSVVENAVVPVVLDGGGGRAAGLLLGDVESARTAPGGTAGGHHSDVGDGIRGRIRVEQERVGASRHGRGLEHVVKVGPALAGHVRLNLAARGGEPRVGDSGRRSHAHGGHSFGLVAVAQAPHDASDDELVKVAPAPALGVHHEVVLPGAQVSERIKGAYDHGLVGGALLHGPVRSVV